MKPFEELSYYELLEVDVTASAEEIRAAYERVLARAAADPECPKALREKLVEAVEFLTCDDLRVEYDRSIGVGAPSPVEARVEPTQMAMTDLLASADGAAVLPPSHPISYLPHVPHAPPPPDETARTEATAGAQETPPSEAEPVEARLEAIPPAEELGGVSPTESPESIPPEPPPNGSRAARPLETAPDLAQESAIGLAEAALAQVSARAREVTRSREPRPKPIEVPPNAEFNGELLRQVRESLGLSLALLAERTRIAQRHLENVEADRYSSLPATVYLRGILMSLARELRLDPLAVSKSYLALVDRKK